MAVSNAGRLRRDNVTLKFDLLTSKPNQFIFVPRNTNKGAITSKIKHAIKHKTSPARLARLLQPSLAFCFSLQPMTAYRPGLGGTPSLAGLVLSFIACFFTCDRSLTKVRRKSADRYWRYRSLKHSIGCTDGLKHGRRRAKHRRLLTVQAGRRLDLRA